MTCQEMNDAVNKTLSDLTMKALVGEVPDTPAEPEVLTPQKLLEARDLCSAYICPICHNPTHIINLHSYRRDNVVHFACQNCLDELAPREEPAVVSRPFAGHESKGVAS